MREKFLKQINCVLKENFEKYFQRYQKEKIGVLVSGGIDSSIIAWWIKKIFLKPVFISIAGKNSKDWVYLNILEKFLKIRIIKVSYNLENLKRVILEVNKVYKKNNFYSDLTHLSLGIGLWLALEEAKKREIKILFSGQGPDVLLGGYHRYRNKGLNNLNKIIKNELSLLEKDKKREKILADHWKIRIIYPYLEENFVNLCLIIPADLKIKRGKEKFILREYGKFLGLPKEIVLRPKKSFQYSSGILKATKKLIE